MVFDLNVIPEWIGGTDAFWYRWTTSKGTDFYDPAGGFGPTGPARADAAAQADADRVNVAVTSPIITLGIHTDSPSNAMLMPTARASRLVASESVSNVSPRVGSLLFSAFFSPRASHSILPPTQPNNANASQGVSAECAASCSPASQPMIGIMNWNRPK